MTSLANRTFSKDALNADRSACAMPRKTRSTAVSGDQSSAGSNAKPFGRRAREVLARTDGNEHDFAQLASNAFSMAQAAVLTNSVQSGRVGRWSPDTSKSSDERSGWAKDRGGDASKAGVGLEKMFLGDDRYRGPRRSGTPCRRRWCRPHPR